MSGTTSPVSTETTLMTESVNLTHDLLQGILDSITNLPSLEADNIAWNQDLTRLTFDISNFVEITTLLSKLMLKHKHPVLPNIKESHIHLLFIMKAIGQASQKSDLVVLEELIKYELKDNLTQWKIDLVPHMKRLLNP